MSSSCANCGASTAREPLCKLCNDEDNATTERLIADNRRLTTENARLKRELAEAQQIADVAHNVAATGSSKEW